jgi:hypothetical protein
MSLVPDLPCASIELPIVRLWMAGVTRLALLGIAPIGSRLRPPNLVLKRVAHHPVRREAQLRRGENVLKGPLAGRVVIEEITRGKLGHRNTFTAWPLSRTKCRDWARDPIRQKNGDAFIARQSTRCTPDRPRPSA